MPAYFRVTDIVKTSLHNLRIFICSLATFDALCFTYRSENSVSAITRLPEAQAGEA